MLCVFRQAGNLVAVEEGKSGGESKDDTQGGGGDDTDAGGGGGSGAKAEARDGEVLTLFATPDHGVQLQGTLPIDGPLEALVGLRVPYLYFASKKPSDAALALAAAKEAKALAKKKGAGDGQADEGGEEGEGNAALVTQPAQN